MIGFLRLTSRTTPAPPVAPEPEPTPPAGNAAAAVKRARRIADARTPAEWLEAVTEWCPAKCQLIIRDANGSRGACGPGCEARKRIGGAA